jgi:hypothetical protein
MADSGDFTGQGGAAKAGTEADEESREERGEVTEANLAITRKVVLYIGLLVAALLFAFPHWRLSDYFVIPGKTQVVDQEIGRFFIANPPPTLGISVARIHYVRQITEVAIALLLTFGLMRVLKKPAGDRKHNVEG